MRKVKGGNRRLEWPRVAYLIIKMYFSCSLDCNTKTHTIQAPHAVPPPSEHLFLLNTLSMALPCRTQMHASLNTHLARVLKHAHGRPDTRTWTRSCTMTEAVHLHHERGIGRERERERERERDCNVAVLSQRISSLPASRDLPRTSFCECLLSIPLLTKP